MDEKARHFFVVSSLLILAALVGFGAPVQAQDATLTATPNPTRVISVKTGHPLAHFYVSWHDPVTGALSAVPSGDFFIGSTKSVSIPANAVNIGLLIQVNDSAGWYAGANCVLGFATADNQHVDIVGGAFQASCKLQPTAAGLATQSARATQTALAPTPTAPVVTATLLSQQTTPTPRPPATITLTNRGAFVARFWVSFSSLSQGSQTLTTDSFPVGVSQSRTIPGDATGIKVQIQDFTGFNWRDACGPYIFSVAQNVSYIVYGTTLSTSCTFG